MKRLHIRTFKDFVGNIPKHTYVMAGCVTLLCSTVFAAAFYTSYSGHVEASDDFSNLPPQHFIPEKPVAMQAPAPKAPEYKVSDIFARVPLSPNISDLETEKEQRNFAMERTSMKGLKKISITYPENGGEPDYSISNIPQFQNMDLDYSRQGEPKTVASYPVDLSRVLPITETVPVILLDEIKSELSGEVVRAKISQDVYGYHKRKILIPAGSTAIGRYEPLKKVGDTRLDIEFYRVLTPEGINIQLTGFAADQEGSQGLTGDIDNKNWEKFGVAGIIAGIQASAQLSVDVNDNNQQAVADAISRPMEEVVTQVISESINIAPTVRIKKGTMFFVKFRADIFFPPARDRQILTEPLNNLPKNQTARR